MARAKSRPTKDGKEPRPVVVKRITRTLPSQRRVGAWKIAYADFVTALMAFFLLMWLVGTSTSDSLRGVAQYFKTPLLVAFSGGKEVSQVDSLIHGGSNSPTQGIAQVKKGSVAAPPENRMQGARINFQMQDAARLRQLKQGLEHVIESNPAMREFKDQLLIDITSDGLRIQIIDRQNRPMFSLGSATLQPYTIDILHQIGKVLNQVPNRVSLSGHTDALPYQGNQKNYSNWELSMDRANASRRALIAGGMDPAKVIRVVGLASSALLDSKHPLNPANRRISIMVLNSRAERIAGAESGGLDIENDAGQAGPGTGPNVPGR